MTPTVRNLGLAEFVRNGSLALAWYFKDEADPYAHTVAARLPAPSGVGGMIAS
jgi:hypothetical protein